MLKREEIDVKLHQALTAIILGAAFLACDPISANQSFNVSRWKTSSKDERRLMAKDFLNKYTMKGRTVDQIKELLGDPDYETDIWSFSLSDKGAPPPGPHTVKVFLEYPQLYVHFKEGKVDELSVTDQLKLADDLRFDPTFWKSSEPPVRLKMAGSLIASGLLKGLTKRDAMGLLGAPESESEDRVISYNLGIRRLDLVTLDFRLDKDGRVLEAWIHED
jgi:hypothetical protein